MNRLARAICVVGMFAGMLGTTIRATDIPIFPKGAVDSTALQSLIWGQSGSQGFNNNYFFTPISLNESVCVYVYNNNTTNAHVFTASIVITGKPASQTPSDGTWQATAGTASLFAAISPGVPAGIGGSVSGASQVSLNFSASVTQAGSPDTANVTIVQTPGNCVQGNQVLSSSPNSVIALSPIQAVGEGLSQSFFASASLLNPTTAVVWGVNNNNSSKGTFLSDATISCTASCSLLFGPINTTGTACPSGGTNLRSSGGFAATSLGLAGTCTTAPVFVGAVTILRIDLAANTPFYLPLNGYNSSAGTNFGYAFELSAAVTGTVTVNLRWYEK